MAIRCCRGCIPPKRYPGCHDHCPEYIAEKAKHETERQEERRKNLYTVYEQRTDSVEKAYKRNGGKKRV